MFRRLLWLVLALPFAATAQEAPCGGAAVLTVLPEAGAVEVPSNARILVEVSGEAACHEGLDVRLVDAGDGVPVTRRAWDVPGGRVYALEPTTPLREGAEHTVEVLGLSGQPGHGELHRFTTGKGWAEASEASPRLRLHAARSEATDGGDVRYEIDLDVAPTHDVQPFDQMRLTIERGDVAPDDEGAYAVTIRPDTEGWGTTLTLVQRGAPATTVCVIARQQNVAGQWSAASRACIVADVMDADASEPGGGCSAAPTSPPMALLILLPLVALRRRP